MNLIIRINIRVWISNIAFLETILIKSRKMFYYKLNKMSKKSRSFLKISQSYLFVILKEISIAINIIPILIAKFLNFSYCTDNKKSTHVWKLVVLLSPHNFNKSHSGLHKILTIIWLWAKSQLTFSSKRLSETTWQLYCD